MLAMGTSSGTIFLWNLTKGELSATLTANKKPVLCIASSPVVSVVFSSKGQVAAAGRDPKIIVCNTPTSAPNLQPSRLEKHKSEVTSLSFSPNGRMLASASRDGTLILWDVSSGQFVYSLHEAELKGDSRAAEQTYRDVTQWASQGKNADLNYQVGLWGILDGFAPAVAAACENAVTVAPPDIAWRYRD